ncbi:hypothetical protein FRB91_004521 [Serendipita sp. 411]|nr:hypothetical protein FRC19_010244 [Serendipita sp. 401]KAG8834101.1 hypothetical protein FRC18_002616 [Serendipita sp. 400]KAG8841977.1 hypothetical protein FRB91_004521 [Serendipita sp. 411]KAG9052690.1 hypothetical protein FS842_009396 [Serendipita sp. 407]
MSNDAGDSKSGPRAFLNRSATTAPRSNRHSASPETSIRRNTSQTTTRPQPLSYRQLLQQRLQKYQWTANHTVENAGTTRNPLWFSSFWLGTIQIGQSSAHRTKGAAKEEAAKAALDWLTTYGYD